MPTPQCNNSTLFNASASTTLPIIEPQHLKNKPNSLYRPPNIFIPTSNPNADSTLLIKRNNQGLETEEDIIAIDNQIGIRYRWYMICLVIAIILYTTMLALFWTDLISPREFHSDGAAYFTLICFTTLLWILGGSSYLIRNVHLHSVFMIGLLISTITGIALIIADMAVQGDDSLLDSATNAKIMAFVLLACPSYMLSRSFGLRRELIKRSEIVASVANNKQRGGAVSTNQMNFNKSLMVPVFNNELPVL